MRPGARVHVGGPSASTFRRRLHFSVLREIASWASTSKFCRTAWFVMCSVVEEYQCTSALKVGTIAMWSLLT
ncbi:hypothetical protein IQ07DRAFT_381435 [Pyrenochaeta sp. DS3sAY3a]|nr:hypothetical protein IQ07DRAFT_381435 [Pyrenochaeta sp. DS3sAY3a]